MNPDQELRQQLVNMLVKRQAHMTIEDAVADFPESQINTFPTNVEYSFWHLLEHLRIAQFDILDYICNSDYQSPNFPDDYWPDKQVVTDFAGWQQSIAQFFADRQALVDLVMDPDINLYAPIPHGWDGHHILREIMVVASHNAYHIGEFGVLRQVMGLW
jgi:hypothetical protein